MTCKFNTPYQIFYATLGSYFPWGIFMSKINYSKLNGQLQKQLTLLKEFIRIDKIHHRWKFNGKVPGQQDKTTLSYSNNSIDTVSIENKILIIWGFRCLGKELLYFDKSFLLIKACSFQNTTKQRNNFVFRGFRYDVSVYL